MKKIIVAVIACSIWTSTLWAQCATGVNTGGGNCIPPDADGMPGYNSSGQSSPAPRPVPVWADQWGAIVMDRDSGEAGTATNKDTKADAVKSAMHDCQMHGAPNCELILSYHNQCAALAIGDGDRSGLSNDPTLEGARDGAMRICSQNSSTCKVVYSECSMARRVR